tara:strand:- start:470 stop:814 length:345 start_codon:yes stop_codon:yes gene_type:complete
MKGKKCAGILRCTKNEHHFETSRGFCKVTGEPQIECIVNLRVKLSRSMVNKIAYKFRLVDLEKWAEVVKMSGAGSYVNDWSENDDIKEKLFTYILNHATWNMRNDGVIVGVLAF